MNIQNCKRDFHPVANHMTQLRNFTKGEFVNNICSVPFQLRIQQVFINKNIHTQVVQTS